MLDGVMIGLADAGCASLVESSPRGADFLPCGGSGGDEGAVRVTGNLKSLFISPLLIRLRSASRSGSTSVSPSSSMVGSKRDVRALDSGLEGG